MKLFHVIVSSFLMSFSFAAMAAEGHDFAFSLTTGYVDNLGVVSFEPVIVENKSKDGTENTLKGFRVSWDRNKCDESGGCTEMAPIHATVPVRILRSTRSGQEILLFNLGTSRLILHTHFKEPMRVVYSFGPADGSPRSSKAYDLKPKLWVVSK